MMDIAVGTLTMRGMVGRLLLLLGPLLAGCFANGQVEGESERAGEIRKIAFGSCFDPRDKGVPMFGTILEQRPDVFVLLGDNIYGDTEDMELLRTKYTEFEAVEDFRKLRDAATLLATWDDHDYGVNDGGKGYRMREESQKIFLDFFDDPPDSPRRGREGVYGAFRFGPPGRICQLLLLDTRYFRDELPRTKAKPAQGTVGWYEPTTDKSKTLLGDAQWKWLEEQLRLPADIRIIASSIQVLAFEKGMENWGNVPHEQRRLFNLLRKHEACHTFAISGDVHFAELSKRDVDGYPFYDLTSSALSDAKPNRSWAAARNSFRIGESHAEANAGWIEIDWEARTVELAIINRKGEKILSHVVKLSELEFPKSP